MIRLLLVDDHPVLRDSLGMVFDSQPDFEVVGHADSLAEAREILEDEVPEGVDLAILDLDLPDGLGLELIKDLRDKNPNAMALVLTGLSEKAQLAMAIEAGAAGVLNKTSRVTEIIEAARKLNAGELLLSPQEIVDAMRLTSQRRMQATEAKQKLDKLTRREREVLQVLAEGVGDKEIAERLYIGVGTVRSHVESILSKLEVASRLQALVFAVRHGAVNII